MRQVDDGRVLLYCHAGCTVDEITSAVGLQVSDLYPPRPVEHGKPIRRPFPAHDLLAACSEDALLICVLAADLADGRALTPEVQTLLMGAAHRIDEARRLAHGR